MDIIHSYILYSEKTDTNQNASVLNIIVWSCCRKRLFSGRCITSRFHIWDCVPIYWQVNDPIWWTEGVRKNKNNQIFYFENARRDIKECRSHWEKTKQYVRHTNQEYVPIKVVPVINFTDEPVIWCDIPVVGNNVVDDSK